jgi:hypothetical protein
MGCGSWGAGLIVVCLGFPFDHWVRSEIHFR